MKLQKKIKHLLWWVELLLLKLPLKVLEYKIEIYFGNRVLSLYPSLFFIVSFLKELWIQASWVF